jgi:hypothetical protein
MSESPRPLTAEMLNQARRVIDRAMANADIEETAELHDFSRWAIREAARLSSRRPVSSGAIPEDAIERATTAAFAWFREHPDGASSEDEWRDLFHTVLEAVWPAELERLRALELGDWQARYSDASHRLDRYKDDLAAAEARLARYATLEAAARELVAALWAYGGAPRAFERFRAALQALDGDAGG